MNTRTELVKVACEYTRRERRDEDIENDEMVELWLRLCDLCRRAERERKRKDNAKNGKQ